MQVRVNEALVQQIKTAHARATEIKRVICNDMAKEERMQRDAGGHSEIDVDDEVKSALHHDANEDGAYREPVSVQIVHSLSSLEIMAEEKQES
jgi:hypothetical protein